MKKTGFFQEFLTYEHQAGKGKEPRFSYVLNYSETADQAQPTEWIARTITGRQFETLSEHMKAAPTNGWIDRAERHYLAQYSREVKRLSATAAVKSGLLEEIKKQPELKEQGG